MNSDEGREVDQRLREFCVLADGARRGDDPQQGADRLLTGVRRQGSVRRRALPRPRHDRPRRRSPVRRADPGVRRGAQDVAHAGPHLARGGVDRRRHDRHPFEAARTCPSRRSPRLYERPGRASHRALHDRPGRSPPTPERSPSQAQLEGSANRGSARRRASSAFISRRSCQRTVSSRSTATTLVTSSVPGSVKSDTVNAIDSGVPSRRNAGTSRSESPYFVSPCRHHPMPTLPVAVAKSLGDDEVEALPNRLFVAPTEEPLGRGVPEHDLPVGVGDQHRVGEAAHHFRERRVIHGRPPNLRAGRSLSGRRDGARGATRPLRGGTGSSLEALRTRARARLRASRRIAPLRRRTPARLSHAWPPGRSRRSRRRCSCPQRDCPPRRVPSRPTANGPNGLPIAMSSASEYSARKGSTSPLMMAASARWLASTASLSSVSFTAPPPVSRFSWQQVAPQTTTRHRPGRAELVRRLSNLPTTTREVMTLG